MRLSTMLLFLACLVSCKSKPTLSDTDKELLQLSIDSHNAKLRLQFANDSTGEAAKIKNTYYDLPQSTVDSYIIAHMEVYRDNWNKVYDIKKDRYLTLAKYLNYCDKNKLDPESFINSID